jgi:hypothetical protein
MADQYGWPVVDIYVDAVPPFPPAPRVIATGPTSVTFTWDPVADQGDGAGRDYFEAGMDHYSSWITVDGGPAQQVTSTVAPRTITAGVLPNQDVCVHVVAIDRVGNATPDQAMCGKALGAPPMPAWLPLASAVTANPAPVGLAGLETWFWLDPRPQPMLATETYDGVAYRITAAPIGADWDFGDSAGDRYSGASSFGVPYPTRSPVTHVFQAYSQSGFAVVAKVRFEVTWMALINGTWIGPYPMGTTEEPAVPLAYRVEQAQPELVRLGP